MGKLDKISGYRMQHQFVLAYISLGYVRHCRLRYNELDRLLLLLIGYVVI